MYDENPAVEIDDDDYLLLRVYTATQMYCGCGPLRPHNTESLCYTQADLTEWDGTIDHLLSNWVYPMAERLKRDMEGREWWPDVYYYPDEKRLVISVLVAQEDKMEAMVCQR